MSHTEIIDGVIHPSVTDILSVLAKPWLSHWYAAEERKGLLRALDRCESKADWPAELKVFGDKLRCTDSVCNCEANFKKRAGADAGTAFHDLANRYISGETDIDVPAKDLRAFNRFKRWVGKHDIKPILLETRVQHPVWKYVGRFDIFCWVDGVKRMGDWKTSNSMDPTFKLQVAAYLKALEAMGLVDTLKAGAFIVRFDKREKPYGNATDEEWIAPEEIDDLFEVFTSLRRPFDFALRNNLLRVG